MDQPTRPDAPGDGPWTLTCLAVRDETPTIKTFTFEASQSFAHQAGQAVTLALPVAGETLYRTFSIASAPGGDQRFEVTVKAHSDGRATAWLHAHLKPGILVDARPPRGHFTLARRSGRGIAFLSGGSGATPLMAMLRHLARSEPGADVAWFHAARSPDEILFAAELARIQEIMPNLTASIAVSRPLPGWFGLRGRPTRRLLSVVVPDLASRDVFCCGPAAFMAEVRLIHAAEGGRRETFHIEAFGPAAPVAAHGDAVLAPDNGSFELLCDGRVVTVRNHETILQACLRQGLIIPCGCGQGLCGTCRVRRLSGTVVMKHHGGLDPEEERAGYILACSSRLASDARISLDV